jgi:hypothetical protein
LDLGVDAMLRSILVGGLTAMLVSSMVIAVVVFSSVYLSEWWYLERPNWDFAWFLGSRLSAVLGIVAGALGLVFGALAGLDTSKTGKERGKVPGN